MRVFLSGMMGTGKSTVGRIAAGQLGLRFVDLDEEIERHTGKTVREYFSAEGEGAFRRVEAELALELSAPHGALIALGGGTVTNEDTRRALSRRGFLITLHCDAEVLAGRVARGNTRPLLDGASGELEERLARRLAQRAPAYAECHARVEASGPPDAVAALVVARISDAPLAVMLGERSYRIEVGQGARSRRPATSGATLEVADDNTARYANDAFRLAPGEANKDVEAAAAIWDAAIGAGLDRHGQLVGVGGGVVGDLTGFAAATYLRGVDFGLVATSIVAMVDSSVGGKTGFNRPGGKNLVGAFHQPSFVLCDIDTLETLPDEEYRSGLAEAVKSVWLCGDEAVSEIESLVLALNERAPHAVERAVRLSITLKANIVADDEREKGQRMLLNLGHTLGHGFEAAAGYGELRHGDAVALGMAAACDVALGLGAMSLDSVHRLRGLLERLRLPIDYAPHLSKAALGFVSRDKKRVGDTIRFVLPCEPGGARLMELKPDVLPKLLEQGAAKRSPKTT